MADELTLDNWDRSTAQECRARAKQLARELPQGFAFRALELHKLGDQQHRMAVYSFEDTEFVLIPGGEVTLGYDAKRHWEPTPEEKESWQGTVEEYDLRFSIRKYIAKVTRRPKRVSLKPFLIEIAAREIGDEAFLPVDENSVEGLEEFTHVKLAKLLAKTGFRFPTSDEWEYACSGGATTLFRWGDHVPCDRYPIDISPAEEEWHRQWFLSGGKLKYPPEGFASAWDLHRRPNAFGIFIASDPYKNELVAELGTTRGGDGGSMICGGAGFFAGWMTLATAYFQKEACKHDPQEPIESDFTIGRRVLPLT